jgi:hypothetical protein
MGRNWQVGGALLLLSLAVIGVVRSMGNLQVALQRWRRRERVRPAGVDRLRNVVPEALQRIAGAREVSDLSALLEEFGTTALFAAIELEASDTDQLPAFVWSTPEDTSAASAGRELVNASYPLPAAGPRAMLRFAWVTEQGDVTPELDILLQLVVDACDARIRRTEVARISKGHLRSI